MAIIECVPNVSEGRRADVVKAMTDSVATIAGVRLLDSSSDPAHNRSVLTMAGEAAALKTAVLALFEQLGAQLVFQVRGMGTTVACLRLSPEGPAILLSGPLVGPEPIAVYRVADYASALEALRGAGATDIHQLEIPQGPCASMRAHGGLRLAIYQLVRPGVIETFAGRVDD